MSPSLALFGSGGPVGRRPEVVSGGTIRRVRPKLDIRQMVLADHKLLESCDCRSGLMPTNILVQFSFSLAISLPKVAGVPASKRRNAVLTPKPLRGHRRLPRPSHNANKASHGRRSSSGGWSWQSAETISGRSRSRGGRVTGTASASLVLHLGAPVFYRKSMWTWCDNLTAHRCLVFQSGRTVAIVGGYLVARSIVFDRFDLDQVHWSALCHLPGMNSNDEKQRKEEPPRTRDVESRRMVIEEYIADLRAFLDRLRRMLNWTRGRRLTMSTSEQTIGETRCPVAMGGLEEDPWLKNAIDRNKLRASKSA